MFIYLGEELYFHQIFKGICYSKDLLLKRFWTSVEYNSRYLWVGGIDENIDSCSLFSILNISQF